MRGAIALVMIGVVCCAGPTFGSDSLYTDAEADCAAKMIFENECSAKNENLLFWSPDEAFPSLGIGHFIWYSEGAIGPYRESFPGFIKFARRKHLGVPAWLDVSPVPPAPWRTRAEFLKELSSQRSSELRIFLERTKREQARYVLRRFRRIFPEILDESDTADRLTVLQKYNLLTQVDGGSLAMADYVNFKGEGLRSDARYEGVGWGLLQVLQEMNVPDDPGDSLKEFVAAAERVLERRIAHAPRPEVESRWLPGWKQRLHSYLNSHC